MRRSGPAEILEPQRRQLGVAATYNCIVRTVADGHGDLAAIS
jgi:hypothetical protein